MAYRPTNDIKENAIHRNTIFESQNLVSCCTCGYCIEKTEDASLTITNFKAAASFNDSLGPVPQFGPLTEFSNYMMPSGSFGPYILYPYKLQYAADSLGSSQEKHADQLVYYPFLKCNGSISGYGSESFPATTVTIGSAGITHPLKYYGSEFGMATGSGGINGNYGWAVMGTATFLSNSASVANASIGMGGAADKIGYDPQFGSYAYLSYRPNVPGNQGNKFVYSNTKITDTAFIPSFCSNPVPPGNQATHSSGCGNYYRWSQYRQKEEGIPFLDWYYFGFYDGSGNPYYNWYYWWWWNTSDLPVNINLKFSSDLTWSLLSLLESGPTENFAKAHYYTNMYSVFNFYYPLNLFTQYNTFFDVSTGNGLQFYCNDLLCTSGVNLRAWISAGPRTNPFPANPSVFVEPCTDQQLDYIIEKGYAGYYNSTMHPFVNKTIPPKPADIDIGNYQPYLDYIASHDYSDLSFKSNSGCTNNITKIMEPVFYKNFDNYSFPYLYEGFNEIFTDYYITDQILAPNFTRCDIEYNRLPNPDPDPNKMNPNPWVPTYPTAEAKTYKIKSLGNGYQILKGGYVLDRFELNKDGSFYATMSIVKENDFFAVSGTRRWEVASEQLLPYVGSVENPQIYCSALFNQWFNIPVDETTTLHASSKFVYSSAFQVQEYEDQTMTGYYVNGLFSNYYSSSPLIYHSDICRGYFGYASNLYCPTSYVGQKSSRTQIISSTNSSGRTTVLIKNVLWIGKQLLKKTYSTDDGSSNYGIVTSIIPTSIGSGYKNTTTISIAQPTNKSRLSVPPVAQAKATPIVTNGSITGYNITDAGRGYDPSNPPLVSFGYPGYGASAKVIVSPQPDVLANGSPVPSYYEASLYGGFESDIEVSFQSTPICKTKDIPDKLKKVTRLKIKFEDYRKIPQSNFIMEGKASILVEATPELSAQSVGGYSGFLRYSPEPNVYVYYVPNNTFDNIAFIEPNVNKDSTSVFYNKIFQSYENPFVKDIVEIDPPVSTLYVSKVGRAYPDFGVPDRFKSCLLVNGDEDVWKTGNEIKFVGLFFKVTNGGSGYTAIPTVTLSGGGGTGAKAKATINGGRVTSVYLEYYGVNYTSNMNVLITGGGGTGATAVDITFTPFYSIYMEEIKNEKQTAGQTLIRIASTLQNALNGIYIPNVGLETLYKGRDLQVKFLYKYKDVSLENTVGFSNFNPNDADFLNEKASSSGAAYRQEGTFQTAFTSQLKFKYFNNPSFSESGVGEFFALSIGSYQLRPYFQMYDPISPYFYGQIVPFKYDRTEVISVSPIKIKYVGVEFIYISNNSAFNPKYVVTSYTPPNIPTITTESTHTRSVGFKCDIILEEFVDEFIQESLPVEFNEILQNVEYIQTSNLMNSRKPMEMINPEQCEHIGKVIDRKDCNCPKKWVRLCDVHGKTDWKKCMQCKDFKVSE